ncbi:hypothetical protein LTR22_017644 [Elasticomyces elasticus]|nr:hypothetical protein LTR22_017644 [Elasticomyces elasticus]KAK4931357.1 hypothetical protein LTR49_002058 [Elasticomyces elasticus]KAK5752594.1 hypothetical protein LTS12_017347 [Elasticomyces elasticus]
MFLEASTEASEAMFLANNTGYTWEPLDTTKPSIRLLTILPATDQNDTIRLTLRTTNLDDAFDSYDAISYMWGSDSNMHEIMIDDKIALVRDNIWQFLVHARDSSLRNQLNSSLWIDSINIDQRNNDEKNHQVRQMRTIYSQARRVIAWLGEESLQRTFSDCVAALNDKYDSRPTHEQASEPLEALYKYMRGLYSATVYKWFRARNSPRWKAWNLDHDGELGLLGSFFDSSRSMCRSPYWSRVWIVQEIIVARDRYCISGDLLLPYNILHDFADRLQAEDDNEDESLAPFGNTILYSPEVWSNIEGHACLDDVVDALSQHHCTDVRDHVYGVLGCVKGTDTFVVDYSVSKEEVLLRSLEFLNRDAGVAGLTLVGLAKALKLDMQVVFQHPNLRREITERRYSFPARICSYFECVPLSGVHHQHHDTSKGMHEIIDSAGASGIFKCQTLSKSCHRCNPVRDEPCSHEGLMCIPKDSLIECVVGSKSYVGGSVSLFFRWKDAMCKSWDDSQIAWVRKRRSWHEQTRESTYYLQRGFGVELNAAAVLGQTEWGLLRHGAADSILLPCSFSSLVELYRAPKHSMRYESIEETSVEQHMRMKPTND